MKTYSVYRVDYLKNKTVKIGKLLDRRLVERNHNAGDMLRLAQIKYAHSSIDSHIFILRDSSTFKSLQSGYVESILNPMRR